MQCGAHRCVEKCADKTAADSADGVVGGLVRHRVHSCPKNFEGSAGTLARDPRPPVARLRWFKAYWLRNNASGSWQARRNIIAEFFDPVQDELDRREDAEFRAVLAEPVSPNTATGWGAVDEELAELKRRFRTASTAQDYRDVGNGSLLTAGRRGRWPPKKVRVLHLRPPRQTPLMTEVLSPRGSAGPSWHGLPV